MVYKDLSVLAVVPARGGSKSIPRKNLCKILGLSLVARAAEVVRSLPWIDVAIISTDDDEITKEALEHGLEAPFRRPNELAADTSDSVDMWQHAWSACEEYYSCRFDMSILLEPTSPLRRPEDVEQTVRKLVEGGHHAAATVSPTPAHFTPHKTLVVSQEGIVGLYHPEGKKHSRRQTINPYYHRNGICYAVMRETLVEHGQILETDCAAVIIDRPIVNIDEPLELEMAEWLLRRGEEDMHR